MQMPQTLKIRNGDKVKPTFSAQEYAARHARLRAYMAEQDIEAAIFTSYHNVNYYSDFLYCSFGRPYALVVTQDKVVSISANIDGGQPWRRTVGTDNIVYTDWQRDNYFVAIQQAAAAGLAHRRRIRPPQPAEPRQARGLLPQGRTAGHRCTVHAHAHDQVGRGAGADPPWRTGCRHRWGGGGRGPARPGGGT
jgi:Creatinase/Prolidase N-terminal domain.